MQIVILTSIGTSLLVTISVWLILSDLEQFNPLRKLIKRSLLTVENVYSRLLEEYLPKKSFLRRLRNYLNIVVLRSGIRRYLPWFNMGYLIFAMAAVFATTYLYFRKLGPAGLLYSAIAVFVVLILLLLMAALNKNAVRKMYLNFLNVYSGFILVEQNEMAALERTSDYVEEPLKSVLKRWTTLYKTSQRSLDECLDGILDEITDTEFRKFLKFTKVNMKYGGDYQKALDKLKEQGEKLQSISAMKTSGAVLGTATILFMIFCTIFLILNATKDPQVMYYLATFDGQVLLATNALAIGFAIYMIFDINRS